jgi:regulator of replication initiation timing
MTTCCFVVVVEKFNRGSSHVLILTALKHEVNEVRTLVNDLVMENNQLTQSVDMLKERVEK